MNQPIRWGIWGAGTIAEKVASDLPLARGAVLQAVSARSGERARTFAERHGAAKWYTGLESLLNDPAVDVVYVATPHHCHAQDTLACIEAGKAVLCEKPFTLNLDEAQRVVDAARKRKLFCMEAMWTRFVPAVADAKRRIDAGEIGSIRLMQGNFAFAAPLDGPARLFDLATGGGALLDLGVYLISMAHHLAGTPESVQGTAVMGPSGVDEQSACQLTFAGGALADLAASILAIGTNEFVVVGETGTVRLCDPFYAAHQYVLTRNPGRPANMRALASAAPSLRQRVVQPVRRIPGAKRLKRRLSPLLDALGAGSTRILPFAGNGYQFELLEVNRCLQEGCTESGRMPLDDSLAVMRTMDTLRAQWGLIFPQEQAATAPHSN